MSQRRRSFCFILSLPPLLSKSPHHARESVGRRKSSQLSVALTAPRLRALHCAEHIGSAFKGGVNACERQLVNEVLGPLVTEFVPNFGREGATPIQRGSNASLLHRVQAVKIIRHNTSRIFRAAHIESWVAYCAQQVQRFDLDQTFWCRACLASTNKSLAEMNKSPGRGQTYLRDVWP